MLDTLKNKIIAFSQIVSVGGQQTVVRTASEFAKLTKVKPPPSDQHVEIIIRRTPFAQVGYS